MRVVVYADILFVLNAYVTYALLLVTDLLCRIRGSRLRRTLSALLGGLYAFVLFLPDLPKPLIALMQALAAAVFVLIAYGKGSRKRFLLHFGAFFTVSFVFAGLMFAVQNLLHPRAMLSCGSVVYFPIDALTLAVLTALCYAVFYIVHLLLGARPPQRSLFRLTVCYGGRSVTVDAFLDSGNHLSEPFSGFPVIVAQTKALRTLLGDADLNTAEAAARLHLRQIPCSSLTGDALLSAFRPDEIVIRGAGAEIRTKEVYIALSDRPICGGDYAALLHPKLTEEANVILCQK